MQRELIIKYGFFESFYLILWDTLKSLTVVISHSSVQLEALLPNTGTLPTLDALPRGTGKTTEICLDYLLPVTS